MKNRISLAFISLSTLVISVFLFSSCGVEDKPLTDDDKVELFGSVVDADSGSPIQTANIRVYCGIAPDCKGGVIGSSVTGSDGYFKLTFSREQAQEGSRSNTAVIEVTKSGYRGYISAFQYTNKGQEISLTLNKQ